MNDTLRNTLAILAPMMATNMSGLMENDTLTHEQKAAAMTAVTLIVAQVLAALEPDRAMAKTMLHEMMRNAAGITPPDDVIDTAFVLFDDMIRIMKEEECKPTA
jgi:hypothetical protein